MDVFKNILPRSRREMSYAKMLDGRTPIFSQFGQNIYVSDVVQMCIGIIANEMSKLQPRHIRTNANGIQTVVNSSINRLFKYGPNELMTTKEFIEKIIWLLYMNNNSFIYPVFEPREDNNGNMIKYYTGFYPLNPTGVDFLQDPSGRLFIEFSFANGSKFTLAYSDVIHLRKGFSVNDMMGGGIDGQPDNQALLKVLQINDTLLQGLDKAIKTSLSVRGVLKINTLMDDESMDEKRKEFEAAMKRGDSSILPMDLKGEYINIGTDVKLVDKDTLEFLQNKVLNYYGVSIPIFTGDFNDEQYQAFYEKTLEPMVILLSQAFTRPLFSTREMDVGNEIVWYQKDMNYLSTNAKMNILKTAGEQGLLSDNQKLALLGYPPRPDGDRITQSLNYIDINLVNAYQMMNKNNTKGATESE